MKLLYLFNYLSVCLSVCPMIHQNVQPSIRPAIIFKFVYRLICFFLFLIAIKISLLKILPRIFHTPGVLFHSEFLLFILLHPTLLRSFSKLLKCQSKFAADDIHYENTSIQIYWKFCYQKIKIFIYKIWYFSCFCSKHRLWVLVRTASTRRF